MLLPQQLHTMTLSECNPLTSYVDGASAAGMGYYKSCAWFPFWVSFLTCFNLLSQYPSLYMEIQMDCWSFGGAGIRYWAKGGAGATLQSNLALLFLMPSWRVDRADA